MNYQKRDIHVSCGAIMSLQNIIENITYFLGIAGTFSLAISGSITAMNKRLDIVGVIIIAFVAAVGGGTIRDILVEGKDIFWFRETTYLFVILAATLLSILFQTRLVYLKKPLLLFDAIGLGLFTITGVEIGIAADLPFVNCLVLGTITGSFGGVLRDIIVNEVPVIFHKEIYATICILGGGLYYLLLKFGVPGPYLQLIPVIFIIALRLLVIYYKISMPSIYRKKK